MCEKGTFSQIRSHIKVNSRTNPGVNLINIHALWTWHYGQLHWKNIKKKLTRKLHYRAEFPIYFPEQFPKIYRHCSGKSIENFVVCCNFLIQEILIFIQCYLHKIPISCHTCRVNCERKQLENRFVCRLTIIVQIFCG